MVYVHAAERREQEYCDDHMRRQHKSIKRVNTVLWESQGARGHVKEILLGTNIDTSAQYKKYKLANTIINVCPSRCIKNSNEKIAISAEKAMRSTCRIARRRFLQPKSCWYAWSAAMVMLQSFNIKHATAWDACRQTTKWWLQSLGKWAGSSCRSFQIAACEGGEYNFCSRLVLQRQLCDAAIATSTCPVHLLNETGRRVRNVEEYPYHISICYMRGTWSKWHRCYCRHVFIASVVLQWTNTRVQLNMKMRDVDWHLAKHRIVGLSRLELVGYTNSWIGKSLSMSADTYSMLSTKAMLSSSNNPPRSDYMLDL